MNGNQEWSKRDSLAVLVAVGDVARRMGSAVGRSAIEAFRKGFGTGVQNPLVMVRGTSAEGYSLSSECSNITGGGCTSGAHLINFASLSPNYFSTARNNVVHELGHSFKNLNGGYPASFAGEYAGDRDQVLRPNVTFSWQLNAFYDPNDPGRTNSEMFSDMFVAWTYDAWNTDPQNAAIVNRARIDMNVNMAGWLK